MTRTLQNMPTASVFLQKCADMNITLNMEKCKFCQTEVTFAGFSLSAEGYQIDTSITNTIHNFPTPASRSDLHSFLGWQTSYLHATVPWHCCWLLYAHCSVQKMIFYGHHTMKMLSWRQKGPSLQHRHYLSLTWTSPHGCALMQADKV